VAFDKYVYCRRKLNQSEVQSMTRQELRETIGENIRLERKARSLSTDELAKLMGVSTSLLNLIERGKRSLTMHNSIKLSQIFNLPLDKFVEKSEFTQFEFKEVSPDGLRRRKLESLIAGLDDYELEFIIAVIKEFKKVKSIKNAEFSIE
jgi:transcriptional regulator with XRE-family HTH domain